MMRTLCIGGPCDGETRDIDNDLLQRDRTILVKESPTACAYSVSDYTSATLTPSFIHTATYVVKDFITPNRTFKVLVHHDMTVDAAFNSLLRCYGGQR